MTTPPIDPKLERTAIEGEVPVAEPRSYPHAHDYWGNPYPALAWAKNGWHVQVMYRGGSERVQLVHVVIAYQDVVIAEGDAMTSRKRDLAKVALILATDCHGVTPETARDILDRCWDYGELPLPIA